MDTLTPAASQKSLHPTSTDTSNVTFSLASLDGALLYNSLDGPKIAPSGQEAAPASPSAQQEKVLEPPTNGISGLSLPNSSEPTSLQQSLANKLRARLGVNGSLEYSLTWKEWAINGQEPICALRASAHRTSDKGCTGWPTPTTRDYKDGSNVTGVPANSLLGRVCHLAGWATPNAANMNDGEGLETWDARQIRNKEKHRNGNGAGMPIAVQVQTITGWCSPTVTDANRGVLPPRPQDTGIPLTQQVSGLTPNSSTAETEKPVAYQLNPHFSRWLMGFPPEWCDCAVTAIQLLPRSRRSSSPQ